MFPALSGAGVEIPQYLRGYSEFPQMSEVKHSLPRLPHRRVSMQCPGQGLGNADTKVFKAVHPLHHWPLLLPKVHYQLLSLADVQKEVVVPTPAGQTLNLYQVGLFIVICDQLHHKLDNSVWVESGYTVMCVQGVQQGLKIQPWGAPLLRTRVDEVCPPTLATWGLPVRKSRTHLHREVFNPRSFSFVMNLEGTMLLNAEL